MRLAPSAPSLGLAFFCLLLVPFVGSAMDTDALSGTWALQAADPHVVSGLELELSIDPDAPDTVDIKDTPPFVSSYAGRYFITGDDLEKLPNGRNPDPYKSLSWHFEGDSLVITNGGVYSPRYHVGKRLVRLKPDPFFDLIRSGNIKALKTVPNLKATATNKVDQIGRTSLYLATIRNQPAIVKLLLELGVPVNLPNKDIRGDNVLFAALQTGNADILSLCFQHGADVNERSGNGRTPLMAAGETCGHYPQLLEILFSAGADADATNAKGLTARQILIQAGAKNFLRIYDEQFAATQKQAQLIEVE